jgi:hypothetical protein
MGLARRDFILAGAAAALAPWPAGAGTARRQLALFHGGGRIGAQTLEATRAGDRVDVRVAVDVAVRLLGMTVYRYQLEAREVWEGGRLASLVSDANNNGRRLAVRASRDGDAVAVEGPRFTGRVMGNPATTSYWAPAFLERGVWIDLEDGRPRRVSPQRVGAERFPTASGSVEAVRWRIGGEVEPIDLFFDAAGEWVGSEFQARGETARFVLADRGAPLTPLWRG